MDIQITTEELRKRKVFVATPMYGGQCTGQYTKSSIDLGILATKYGMDINFFYLFNESLIPRARNYLVDEFLRSGYTHMMFIDADIGFDPNDVFTMAALADPDGDKDIVCGPYPKKAISWEKIKDAVDKGFADENPNNLERFVGDFVLNFAPEAIKKGEVRLDEPVEVLEGGTGFMMIQRRVFERFAEAHPELSYKPDHVRTKNFNGKREITAFFDTVITSEEEGKRYLSEDYMFCQYVRKLGMKTYMCPWMRTTHTGTYIFGGSMSDLAQLGANMTADINKMKY
jgi:hypothetical protein